jgi:ketol-acid reductoisomerase
MIASGTQLIPTSKRPAGVYGREDVSDHLELDCDVVIVGSGAGGATAAAELAEGGLEVIVLEEGGYLEQAYEIDQSPYAHLDTFEELAKQNAGRIFRQMEFE